jgi:hypothetical protein
MMTHLGTIRAFPTTTAPCGWLRCAAYLPPGNDVDGTVPLQLIGGVNREAWRVDYEIATRWADGSAKRIVLFSQFERDSASSMWEDFELVTADAPGHRYDMTPFLPRGSWAVLVAGVPVVWKQKRTLRTLGNYQAVVYEPTAPEAFPVRLELYAELVGGECVTPSVLRATWSDPKDTKTYKDLQALIEIKVEGMGLHLEPWAQKRLPLSFPEVNDGQGIALPFELDWSDSSTFPASRRMEAWHLEATSHGGFGLLGRPRSLVLDEPTLTMTANARAAGDVERMTPGCWEAIFGHPSESGATGEHGEFGLLAPGDWLFWGAGRAIEVAKAAFYAEAARPIWFFDEDGRPVTPESHPKVVWWGERPYPYQGSDMLGKEGDINPYAHGARTSQGYIWTGSDEQHAQNTAFVVYPALTADPCAEQMLRERSARWRGCLATNSGNETVDGTGSGRAARLLSMLALSHEVFPSKETRDVLDANVMLYARQWRMDNEGVPYDLFHHVLPQQVYGPSEQAGGLLEPHWRPWEDAIVAVALAQCYAIEGLANRELALQLAATIATNCTLHGLEVIKGKTPGGADITTYRLYVALAWNGGVPLSEAQLQDPALAKNGAGTGYTTWAFGAFVVANNSAIMMGERVPLARMACSPIIARAQDLIRQGLIAANTCWTSPSAGVDTSETAEWLAIEPLSAPAWAALPVSEPSAHVVEADPGQ